jgi:hypothetical protein
LLLSGSKVRKFIRGTVLVEVDVIAVIVYVQIEPRRGRLPYVLDRGDDEEGFSRRYLPDWKGRLSCIFKPDAINR